jgi:hypothetical protein
MTESTTPPPEQLRLLTEVTVPVQFRLDEATRRRGLRHIAEIRARLEQQSSRPEEPSTRRRRRQHTTARRPAA